MKKLIYNYYWVFAGILIGAMTVWLAYYNLNLILQDATDADPNKVSWLGMLEVVVIYAVVIYVVSLGQKLFKPVVKKKR